jgi:hypothetical protein
MTLHPALTPVEQAALQDRVIHMMAAVLRTLCTPVPPDRERIMCLVKRGFRLDEIAQHLPAAERRAGLARPGEPRLRLVRAGAFDDPPRECLECEGTGAVRDARGRPRDCRHCHATGVAS